MIGIGYGPRYLKLTSGGKRGGEISSGKYKKVRTGNGRDLDNEVQYCSKLRARLNVQVPVHCFGSHL